LWALCILSGIAIGGLVVYQVWLKPKYPYGASHSCSKGLGLDLRIFANANDGWFPHGMKTPEASLSLLCTNDPNVRLILRGKHLPQEIVDQSLASDGVLGPASCGWHYIEGLREDDDPQLAVLWDRITGLGHNGQRRSGLEREVVMIDGSAQQISKEAWPAFVREQKKLLAETAANRPPNSPPIRWSDEQTLGPNTAKPSALKR